LFGVGLAVLTVPGGGVELSIGGGLLLIASAAFGELDVLDPAAVSARSLLGLGYLILLGSSSLPAPTILLLHASAPERVATCAYANPVVAVALEWTR
jgi:hypothetical protein